MKESDVQRQILDYLTLKRIFHYRHNSGAFKDSNNQFYRFGALGSPDIICVINGQLCRDRGVWFPIAFPAELFGYFLPKLLGHRPALGERHGRHGSATLHLPPLTV